MGCVQPACHPGLRVIQLDPGFGVGVGFSLSRVGSHLQADGIVEGGCLHQWNQLHPSMQLRPGDRILSVNGIEVDGRPGNLYRILGEFRTGSVQLVVVPREIHATQPQWPSTPSSPGRLLPPGFVEDLPRGTAGASNNECPICLEKLEDDCDVMRLPCRHAFHIGCANSWLIHFATCPMCRFQLLG